MRVIHPIQDKLTVVSYLKAHKSAQIGIKFFHGLGDLVSFMPYVKKVQQLYPESCITVYTNKRSIVPLFCNLKLWDNPVEDVIFEFIFPDPGNFGHKAFLTKPKLCAYKELGLPLPILTEPLYMDLNTNSSQIAIVNYTSVSSPFLDPPKNVKADIAQVLKEEHLLPIEMTFERGEKNFPTSLQGNEPNIKAAVALLKICDLFVGILSGPAHLAALLIPEKTIVLEQNFYTKTYIEVPQITVESVNRWNISSFRKNVKRILANRSVSNFINPYNPTQPIQTLELQLEFPEFRSL